MVDWGAGQYELTAAQLAPAADTVVASAGAGPAVRLLDVACGTGNAALAAARLGATITGVDLAPRLVGVARERATAARLSGTWLVADAMDLPFEDGTFDASVSVFGAIFARDPARAAAELVRVVRPGGVVVVASWMARGPMTDLGRIIGGAVAAATGAEPAGPPPQAAWTTADGVGALFAAAGVEAVVEERSLSFAATSPDAYVDEQREHHPMWIGLPEVLDADAYAEVLGDATEVLTAANQAPDAFLVQSPWLLTRVAVP